MITVAYILSASDDQMPKPGQSRMNGNAYKPHVIMDRLLARLYS
jgi:hypothetical protein